MIEKSITQITEQDIRALVDNESPEGKTLEYKAELPSADQKKEFLADVSSFANTLGGDLIFGIREESGLAAELVGISDFDSDATKQRLENMIRDGIKPRLQCEIGTISLQEGRGLVIVRTRRSWLLPHRVIYRGHDKFYARNSAGKYQMDTQELRSAFTMTDRATQQAADFIRNRLAEISINKGVLPLAFGPKVVLHMVPLEAFKPGTVFPVVELRSRLEELAPLHSAGWDDRINMDGLLIYSPGRDDRFWTYTQFYRNGIVEAVESLLLNSEKKRIPSFTFEKELLGGLRRYLATLRQLGVSPPINISLALLGVEGFRMGVPDNWDPSLRVRTIDRENLVLPDGLIEDLNQDPSRILKPFFDVVWNACGYSSSPYFDTDGNWHGKERP